MSSFTFRAIPAKARAKTNKLHLFPVYGLLFLGLMSCQGSVSNISELQQERRVNSRVYLRGRVNDRAPFLEGGAYQLKDDTGSIWIITNRSLPASGEEIKIRGRLQYENIPIDGTNLGEFFVLEEQQLENL